LVGTFDYKSFITHYIGIPIYVFGFFGYKCEVSSPIFEWRALSPSPLIVINKTKWINPYEADLSTGGREYQDLLEFEEEDEFQGHTFKEKMLYKLKNF